jgi:DNA-binding NarL/FixJ family response regulator
MGAYFFIPCLILKIPASLRKVKEKLGAQGGEANSSEEALALFKKGKWDFLALDIAMPGRGGLDLLAELKQSRPRLPVLVFSIHPEKQYGVRALKAGAAGYLSKQSPPAQLIQAIRQILSGRKEICEPGSGRKAGP